MEAPQEFSVSGGYSDGFKVFVVRGELDEATAPELDRVLDRVRNGERVIVDLNALDFMSSAGIRVLFRVRMAPTALVCSQDSMVARLLDIVGADRQMPVFDTLDHAIQSLSLSQIA